MSDMPNGEFGVVAGHNVLGSERVECYKAGVRPHSHSTQQSGGWGEQSGQVVVVVLCVCGG